MRELFIYYRIDVAHAHAALLTVQQFQRRLRERYPGLNARLLRRTDESESARAPMQTWMETYSFDGNGTVTSALQAEIDAEARALARFIEGARHTEAFVPCAS